MTTGRIFEIKRFAVHDGPGIRTTFFFKGCPLSCVWCHNPEGISAAPELALIERLCISCGECVNASPKGLHKLTAKTSDSVTGNNARQILPEHNISTADGYAHSFKREGCVLCLRCVNACMPQALKLYGKEYTSDELFNIAAGDADFYQASGGGVTCSGGEPLAQAEFIAEFLRLCKDGGLHTAVDTSGYAAWQAFEKVIPYADIFLYDIKHMDAAAHKRLTGKDNALILENLKRLSSLGVPVEVRLPIIPGLNDGEENITQTAAYLKTINSLTLVRVLPYHAYSSAKYSSIGRVNNMPQATGEEVDAADRAREFLRREGVQILNPAVSRGPHP